MKKLKKISFATLIMIFLLSFNLVKAQSPHYDVEIGIIQNDNPIFTVDTNVLKNAWSNYNIYN